MNTQTDIRIYNSLTRSIEKLTLNENGEINMFVCGPTVYDHIHIGNARTFTIFDSFARFLVFSGIKLNYIQNITDIDDKIINKALELGVSPLSLSAKYTDIFIEDMQAIDGLRHTKLIKATDKIPEIIAQVEKLIAKGNAYIIENDGYYFDLASFPDYGKLSRRTTQMAEDGTSRIDDNPDKRNRGDFCLWKFKKSENEPSWPAPFGEGRPGWHIEDTAITESVFGPQYDIHGGGQDLMFPHHEAEIAQQESASGLKPFVRYWMHCAFLINKGERMGKSKGNFTTMHDMLKNYKPEVIRYYFLSSHYRSPLSFDEASLQSAHGAVSRIVNFQERLTNYETGIQIGEDFASNAQNEFIKALSDDFNTPDAFGVLFDLIKKANTLIDEDKLDNNSKAMILDFLAKVQEILGVIPKIESDISPEIQELITRRQEAKNNKDFAKADIVRDEIRSLGYEIKDTPTGQQVTKI